MAVALRQKEKKIKMRNYVILLLAGLGLGTGLYLGVGTANTIMNEIKNIKKLNVDSPQAPIQAAEPEEQEKPTETETKLVDLNKEVFVILFGPIGRNAIDVANAIKKAASEHKTIWLLIDSPGGSVISGAQIVTAIESAGVEVNTVCITICASMAAIIHQYGTNRYMVDRSLLMFHEAAGGVEGTVPQMISQLKTMNRYIEKMVGFIARRAGMSFQELDSKLAAELWIDAEDSLQQHFSDGTINVYFEEKNAANPPEQNFFPFLVPSNRVKVQM